MRAWVIERADVRLSTEEVPMAAAEETVRAYFTALNGADLEGIVGVFAEDGTIMADEAPTATGLAHIRATYAWAFQAMRFRREVHIDRLRGEGDVAVAQTHSTGTVSLMGDDRPVEAVNRELFVLRKGDAGWRITEYMFNRAPDATPS
jgi:uncharacterized protein (TIGR02246 family)